VMQVVSERRRCMWCDNVLDPTNGIELSYNCCVNCLYPLPTE